MIAQLCSIVGRQLCAVAIVFAPVVVLAEEQYPESLLIKDVRDSELIVQGVVTSVGSDEVPQDSLFGQKQPGKNFPVTTIEVAVDKVLKGKWDARTITAILTGDPGTGLFHYGVTYDYEAGDNVVLCLHYDARIMGGAFRLWGDAGSFVKRGDRWISRGERSREVSLAAIDREAQTVTPGRMVDGADAVVLGTVESVSRREFDCGFPILCIADYVTVRVEQSWKGPEVGESILVRALRRGSNLPWYAPVPMLRTGEPYLMFLRRDDVGFYPFVGFNGFLRVDGEELIMNGHVPYALSRSKVLAVVQEEVSR